MDHFAVDSPTRSNESQSRIRIILADNNPGLRAEVQRILESEFDIVAAVSDGEELLRAFNLLQPDVVVTDISMPHIDGFEAAAELQRRGMRRIVFFTVHEDGAFFDEAMTLGALGYVLKRSPPSVLATAIRAAYDGRRFASPGFKR